MFPLASYSDGSPLPCASAHLPPHERLSVVCVTPRCRHHSGTRAAPHRAAPAPLGQLSPMARRGCILVSRVAPTRWRAHRGPVGRVLASQSPPSGWAIGALRDPVFRVRVCGNARPVPRVHTNKPRTCGSRLRPVAALSRGRHVRVRQAPVVLTCYTIPPIPVRPYYGTAIVPTLSEFVFRWRCGRGHGDVALYRRHVMNSIGRRQRSGRLLARRSTTLGTEALGVRAFPARSRCLLPFDRSSRSRSFGVVRLVGLL